jgi:FkbM family methyltransferase
MILPTWLKARIGRRLASSVATDGIVTARDGRLFVHIQDGLFFRVAFEGLYEPKLTDIFRKYIEPSDVILDVGANFGWYATLFGKRARSGAVYSYEPVPDTFAALCRNIELNDLSSIVTAHAVCVGKENGEITFIRTENSGLGHVATVEDVAAEQFKIPLVTLDGHADKWRGRIALIKIHVEGFELEVLGGAENLLLVENQPIVQVKLTDARMARYGANRQRIVESLIRSGLSVYELSKNGTVVATNSPHSHEIFGVGRGRFAERFVTTCCAILATR